MAFPEVRSANAQILAELASLAFDQGTRNNNPLSFINNATEMMGDFFDSNNYESVRDPWFNTYSKIPKGDIFTDVDVSRDLEFKEGLVKSQGEKINYLLSILSGGPERLAALMQTVYKNLSDSQAYKIADNMLQNITDKNPLLLEDVKQLSSRLQSTVDFLANQKKIISANAKQLSTKVGEIINGFNGGGN